MAGFESQTARASEGTRMHKKLSHRKVEDEDDDDDDENVEEGREGLVLEEAEVEVEEDDAAADADASVVEEVEVVVEEGCGGRLVAHLASSFNPTNHSVLSIPDSGILSHSIQ